MTITSTPSTKSYATDGVTVAFPIPFPFDTAEDLSLILTDASGNPAPVTSGIVITGGNGSTGTATFDTAPAADQDFTVSDDLELTQEADYTDNDAFPAETHERALDRGVRISKRLLRTIGRAPLLPDGDPIAVAGGMAMPSVVNRKGKYWFWNASNGDLEAAAALGTTTISQSIIGALLYGDQTEAEAINGILPSNTGYPECHVRRYGAVQNGVTDDRAAWAAADLVAAGRKIKGAGNGVSHIGAALTINSPINDTHNQVFSTTSAVTLGARAVRPEWFGSAAGNIRLAVNALPSTGGAVYFQQATYPPSYDTADGTGDIAGTDYLAKPGVKLYGTLPDWNAGHTGFVAGTGTIIQGLFAVFADGFEIHGGIGVDCSDAVVTALYGGTAKDAFVIFQPNKAVPTYIKNVKIDAVRGVAKSPGSMIHAVLIEATQQSWVGLAEGSNAYHCVVVKSLYTQVDEVRSFLAGGEGLILKSDDYANMGAVQVGKAILDCASSTFGLRVEATGAAGDAVQIDSVYVHGAVVGVSIASSGQILADVQIDKVIVDGATTGVQFDGVRRCNIDQVILSNITGDAVVSTVNQATAARVGEAFCTNIGGNAMNAQGLLRVGHLTVDAVTGYAFTYGGSGRIYMEDGYTELSAPTAGYWPLLSALTGTWANYAASTESNWQIRLRPGGKVGLDGLIVGTGNVITLSAQVRPPKNMRFPCSGGSGGPAYNHVELVVASNGIIGPTNTAACANYLSVDGIEWPVPGF